MKSINIILILQFLNAIFAQETDLGGAVQGRAIESGEGLPFFTSKGAILLEDLVEVGDIKSFREGINGEVENTLQSPFKTEPVEEGLIQLGNVMKGERVERKRALRELNVFLPDTRSLVNENAYPARCVGRWRGCTATLILDTGIIVTNSHCLKYLPDGSMDPDMWTKSFYAGFRDGTFLDSSKPKAIWFNKASDYAVLKLWKPLDATLGRYGVYWRSLSFFSSNKPLSMISYSGDHCKSWNDCRPRKSTGGSRGTSGDNVFHDLDATRGSSGSAMYETVGNIPVMDALNWGEDRNGGDVSLTFNSYTGNNPNLAKPAGVWKTGYDKVKVF